MFATLRNNTHEYSVSKQEENLYRKRQHMLFTWEFELENGKANTWRHRAKSVHIF